MFFFTFSLKYIYYKICERKSQVSSRPSLRSKVRKYHQKTNWTPEGCAHAGLRVYLGSPRGPPLGSNSIGNWQLVFWWHIFALLLKLGLGQTLFVLWQIAKYVYFRLKVQKSDPMAGFPPSSPRVTF